MPITIEDIKVIHFDFEKEMYEPIFFEYNMEMFSGVTPSTQYGKVSLLVRWKFETFELGSKTRYGSYISEQIFLIDYLNEDLDELKCDINDALSQSLSISRDSLISRKGKLKDIAIAGFQHPNFPEIDHILYALDQISEIS